MNFENSKKIRVGVLGCGKIVSTVHLPVLLNIPHVEVIFLYDLDHDVKEEVSKKFELPFLDNENSIPWDSVDCFLVATPYGTRKSFYDIFAVRGRKDTRLFIEKPVILSERDKEEFDKNGLFHRSFAGFMRRHYSNTNILKKFVSSSGFFDGIKSISVSSGSKTTAALSGESHYKNFAHLSGGGVLPEMAIHVIDQLDFMFPDSSIEVVSCLIRYDGDIDVHIQAKMNIFLGSEKIPLEANFSRVENIQNKITIDLGGVIFGSGLAPEDKVFIRPDGSNGAGYALEHDVEFATNSYQAFYLEWISIIEDIKSKKISPNRLSASYKSGLLVESLYNVARQKGSIERI